MVEKRRMIMKGIKYPVAITLPFILMQIYTLMSIQQLPSPIYGGDMYWHYGEALGISEGRMPWENPQVSGEYAYYGWFTQFLISLMSFALPISLLTSFLFISPLLLLSVSILSYYLGIELFHRKRYAVITALLAMSFGYTFLESWRVLSDIVLVSGFLLFFARAIRQMSIKQSAIAGVFMGMAGLSHIVAFPALAVFSVFAFIIFSMDGLKILHNDNKLCITMPHEGIARNAIKNIRLFLPMIITGTIIAMLFFYPIIFIYHLDVVNPVNEYTEIDLKANGIMAITGLLSSAFFNTSSIFAIILSLLSIAGIYFAFERDDMAGKIAMALVTTAVITGTHYFITLPLFGKALIPLYFFSYLMKMGRVLLVAIAIVGISDILVKHSGIFLKAMTMMLFINVAWIGVGLDNEWHGFGSESNVFSEISEWIGENTERDDVFLSHEELAFAVNGISTRNVMTSRRTHFSPYVDIDKRIADSAVIMYGDGNLTAELLIHYNVSYFYWDANWMYFAQNEPTITLSEYQDYWDSNGVRYEKGEWYLDPAWNESYPHYGILAAYPAYDDTVHPWNDELDKYMVLEKTFYYNGTEFARIFRVDA